MSLLTKVLSSPASRDAVGRVVPPQCGGEADGSHVVGDLQILVEDQEPHIVRSARLVEARVQDTSLYEPHLVSAPL